MALLPPNDINDVINAFGNSGIDLNDARRVFIQGIDPRYVAALPLVGGGIGQVIADLNQMNHVERLTTGQIPLQIYLRNASFLLKNRQEEEVILGCLDNITHTESGVPRVAIKPPDIQQQVIHRDDTVSFAFMEAGLRLAASTLKLVVPSYQGGQQRKKGDGQNLMFLGTGWLISNNLVVTNHHVINARREGEAPASDPDLVLQATRMIGQFDYDSADVGTVDMNFSTLEAWEPNLDYAIVRLPGPTQRQKLTLNRQVIIVGQDAIPVNIIQHPNGLPKRFGIRNNLMHFADPNELRYFTDTDRGSSGAAVMDDKWTVVGLHRGASRVSNVQFQGKTTAWVNIGTQITAIVNDIRNRYPGLSTELAL